MNPVLFQIGDFSIRWYSVLILIGVFFGYELAEYEGKKHDMPKDFIFNTTFSAVVLGLIGARLYYCIFNMQYYSHDLLSILKFWDGGLAIHGGLLFGLFGVYINCKRYNMKFAKVLDIVVVSLILAQAIGRWGNFFNSEAHGAATTYHQLKANALIPEFVINGMNINGVYYEPCFYYESLWCLAGFVIMILVRKFKKKLKIGSLTCFYLMWYSIGRIMIERSRTDSLMLGGAKMAIIVSLIMFAIGLIWIMIISRKSPFDDLYHETKGKDVKF